MKSLHFLYVYIIMWSTNMYLLAFCLAIVVPTEMLAFCFCFFFTCFYLFALYTITLLFFKLFLCEYFLYLHLFMLWFLMHCVPLHQIKITVWPIQCCTVTVQCLKSFSFSLSDRESLYDLFMQNKCYCPLVDNLPASNPNFIKKCFLAESFMI